LILEDHDISDIIAMDSEYHEHPAKEIAKNKQEHEDNGDNNE
jgi:hypothetical protein